MTNVDFEEELTNATPAIYYMDYINLIHAKHLKNIYSDITPRDFTYLANIFFYQGISQRELANMLFVSESNVTQIIKRLEKNGYVIRRTDEKNKSRKNLILTEKAKTTIISLLKIIYEWEMKFFEKYDKEDVDKFKKMLKDYSEKTIHFGNE